MGKPDKPKKPRSAFAHLAPRPATTTPTLPYAPSHAPPYAPPHAPPYAPPYAPPSAQPREPSHRLSQHQAAAAGAAKNHWLTNRPPVTDPSASAPAKPPLWELRSRGTESESADTRKRRDPEPTIPSQESFQSVFNAKPFASVQTPAAQPTAQPTTQPAQPRVARSAFARDPIPSTGVPAHQKIEQAFAPTSQDAVPFDHLPPVPGSRVLGSGHPTTSTLGSLCQNRGCRLPQGMQAEDGASRAEGARAHTLYLADFAEDGPATTFEAQP